VQNYLDGIEQLRLVGLELLLGRLFDQIDFNQIDDPVFKQLVLYRIAFPKSKLKTTEYLYRYQGLSWEKTNCITTWTSFIIIKNHR